METTTNTALLSRLFPHEQCVMEGGDKECVAGGAGHEDDEMVGAGEEAECAHHSHSPSTRNSEEEEDTQGFSSMASLLLLLPPLQRCGHDEGWFVSTIDAHETEIEQLSSRLPSSCRPHNGRQQYKRGYHRVVLRCAVRSVGGALKSKRATRNKHSTQFWCLVRRNSRTASSQHMTAGTPADVVQRSLTELKSWIGAPMWRRAVFVDPAAGRGSFFTALPRGRRIGVEQDTQSAEYLHDVAGGDPVVCGDFCRVSAVELGLSVHDEKHTQPLDVAVPRSIVCVVGRPPHGDTCAQSFLTHACSVADTVAVLLPAAYAEPGSPQARAVDQRLHLERAVQVVKDPYAGDMPCMFCVYRQHYHVRENVPRRLQEISVNRKRKAAIMSPTTTPTAAIWPCEWPSFSPRMHPQSPPTFASCGDLSELSFFS